MRQTSFALMLLALTSAAWPLAVHAEPTAAQGGLRPGAYRHDGFYFRLASGFGAFDERLSSAGAPDVAARSRGIATLGELSLGGSVGRGWVIGGGIYSADLLASTLKLKNEDTTLPEELDTELRSAGLIAAFFDRYPDPDKGFHYILGAGLATLTPRVFGDPATERSDYAAVGGGLLLGVGYEWWIAEQWSLGVLSRATILILGGHDESDTGWTHIASTSPGLLVSLTYH